MILAIGIMAVITVTQVITNTSQTALENGNKQAANTFTTNNKLEELVNYSLLLEKRIVSLKFKPTLNQAAVNNIKDSLTSLGYNITILQKTWNDSGSISGLNKIAGLINTQVNESFKILAAYDNSTNKILAAPTISDSLQSLHVGDSIYNNAIEFQKQLEKLLRDNLLQNNVATTQLATLNFTLAIVSLIAVLILVIIIIRRQKKQLLLINDLDKAKTLAQKNSEIKDRFLANMSHEIRTPLNALKGFSKLLLGTTLNTEQLKYTNIIETSSNNLLLIVNDILDLSKIEADNVTISQAVFDVHTEVTELAILFEPLAKEKNIELTCSVQQNISHTLSGDAIRLKQILVNLVGNAIKFTDAGKVSIEVTLLENTAGTQWLQCTVTDTGIGIPALQLYSIFERFEQVDTSFSRKQGGTGLGLAIVKKITALMGGNITVESVPGKGSAFTINLPFVVVANKSSASIKNNVDCINYTNSFLQKTILLVEDNAMNQMLLESMLTPTGATLLFANNGAEAIQFCDTALPDVLLMDVQMPVMDGIEATKMLRKKFGNSIPIVAMTAHVLPNEKQKCLDAGMNYYISKPIDQAILLQHIAQICGIGPTKKETTAINNTAINKLGLSNVYKLCNNNEAAVKQILTQLCVQMPTEIQALQQAVQEKNISQLQKIVHNFTSTVSPLNDDVPSVVALQGFSNTIHQQIIEWPLVQTETNKLVLLLQHCNTAVHNFVNET